MMWDPSDPTSGTRMKQVERQGKEVVWGADGKGPSKRGKKAFANTCLQEGDEGLHLLAVFKRVPHGGGKIKAELPLHR